MKLSTAQTEVLQALISGSTLKAHRYLNGEKVYRVHPLAGQPKPIERKTVDSLKQHQLIDSNKKFPTATYILTERGKAVAMSLTQTDSVPLSARINAD